MNSKDTWYTIASSKLRIDEGDKQYPYKDTKGILTIGVGHNLEAKGLPKPIRDALLEYDINEVYMSIQASDIRDIFNHVNDVRKAVLINIGFNVGVRGLLLFKKMINALLDGDYQRAANEIRNSQLADGRKERLAKDMENG